MTVEQIAQLAAQLDARRVKSRQGRGAGAALSYLETHDVIRTANTIFGFGQWGHEVVELRPLPAVPVKSSQGKEGIQVGYLCTVRLTVEGCVPVSGIGFGDAVEYTQSAAVTAHELAAKEAESDALKRALKNYGDQFGLALYDKAKEHVTNGAANGHRADPVPPIAPEVLAVEKTKLLALIKEKAGDTLAASKAFDTAASTEDFAEWLAFQTAHWAKQPKPFKAPVGAA